MRGATGGEEGAGRSPSGDARCESTRSSRQQVDWGPGDDKRKPRGGGSRATDSSSLQLLSLALAPNATDQGQGGGGSLCPRRSGSTTAGRGLVHTKVKKRQGKKQYHPTTIKKEEAASLAGSEAATGRGGRREAPRTNERMHVSRLASALGATVSIEVKTTHGVNSRSQQPRVLVANCLLLRPQTPIIPAPGLPSYPVPKAMAALKGTKIRTRIDLKSERSVL